MTPAACEFITPLTLQALSGNPVHLNLLDTEAEAGMGHIELARWADLILIAPATADFIARLNAGNGNDLLATVCLASASIIAIAPAMNQAMWHNQTTQENLQQLSKKGIVQFGPAAGLQACGDVGFGRMLEPDVIANSAATIFETGALAGKKVVITAGPTREAIDPVRYISNHSSGKMGYAIAEAAAEAGAKTVLISGPTNLSPPSRVEFISINSAQDMYEKSIAALKDCDIFIASAAVADYRPTTIADQKIKKGGQETMTIELVKNPDIVTSVAASTPKPFTVGFSAETQNVSENARDKLQRKKLDLIIANDVSNPSIGFNSDENAVTLIWADKSNEETIDKCSKKQLARHLISCIALKSH